MFMIIDSFDLGILEKQWWMKSVDFFAGKYYFFSRFCGSRSDALLKGLKTVENKEVSSAKNLILHLISFSRSLTKTRNSKGPRTDPCGTPDKMGAHFEFLPLITTR